MNSRGRTCKIFFLLAAFWLFYLAADAATYYSRQSGAWNSRFTWSTSGHTGGAAASFPAAGDIVYIGNHTVTVAVNATITQVFFNRDYQPGNLVINSGITLNVSGSVTVVSDDDANISHTLSGAGTLNCSSLNVGTNIDPGRNQTTSFTTDLYSLNISGNVLIYSNRAGWWTSYYNNSSIVVNSGNVRVGGLIETDNENSNNTSSFSLGNDSPYLFVGGATSFDPDATGTSTIILNGAGATVDYFRSGIQTVLNTAYTNLTLSGSGVKTIPAGVTVSGMLSMEGTATVSGSAPSYGTASAIRYRGSAAQTTGIELTPLFSGDGGLIIDNAAGVNLGSSVTLASGLNLVAGNFNVGGNTLTLNGPAITRASGNLSTTAASSLVFGGSSPGIYIPASVITLNSLTINNANGVSLNGNLNLAAGGVLSLSAGILYAENHTISVTNTSASAVTGSESSFINVTSGGLQRTLPAGLAGTGSNYLFPIGESGTYKAINLVDVNTGATGPVLKASVSPTGALNGDNTTIISVDPAYWTLQNINGGNFTRARIELYEGGLDASKTIGMASAPAGNYSTIGGTPGGNSIISQSVLNPGPYFAIGTLRYDTFYSYMSGNWNDPFTWTSDPSGTLQVGNQVPGDASRIVILTDRTVTLTQNVTQSGLSVTIAPGAFLDQAGYRFTSALASLSGQGTIKLASTNFPAAAANSFVDAGGGTAEYYNSSNFTLTSVQAVYNNLVINTSGATATQLSDLTLNGNLLITNGTFRINDNSSTAKLSLAVGGNVTVETGASIAVGNGVTNTAIGGTGGTAPYLNYYLNFHTVRISGDFTNNGTVRFTNLNYPIYNAFPPTTSGATSGAATVYFEGASDNILTCNGVTDFYNLIVNKGTDQTYGLTVSSSAYPNFRIFGANDQEAESVSGNPAMRKALWIYAGTLVLKGNIFIPSLSEGSLANAHYYIPSNGALICDGVDVVVFVTADDYREVNTAYGVSASGNVAMGINTAGTGSSLYVFGRLGVNNGVLSAKESGGIVTSATASGQIIINGGVVDAKQFLSSSGSASYSQSGGLLILRGRFRRTPAVYTTITGLTDMTAASLNTSRTTSGISALHGSFNLENTDNIYTVSGGTIRIYDVTTTATAEAFDVKSSPANINVTGGTLEIIPTGGSGTDATSYSIYSTAPLHNLIINRASGAAVVRMSTPLNVTASLSVISGALNANSSDLSVGGNFLLETGTTYTTGTNTTTFNGSSAQLFTINHASPLSLSSFSVTKPGGVILALAGTQNTVNVSSALNIVAGTLNDGGKILNVSGNIFNSGLATGTGKIVLNGTTAQTINGGGTFGNLELANTSATPVSLLNRTTVNGDLNFAVNGNFNIGTYNLHLNDTASILNAGTARFIQTAGNAGDGGLSRSYSSNDSFIFPVGMTGRYTPATIGFTASPAAYGSVSVNPVDYEHPVTTVNGQSLSYYWRVKSTGFSGIPLFSVSHIFVYSQTDVAGTESSYVPALYDNVSRSWYIGRTSDINISTNTISDWATPTNSTNFLDGDYTAGSAGSFGLPRIYYSRQNGLWGSTSTWSLTGHTVTNPPSTAPGANDIVIIGGNDSIWLATETPPLPPAPGSQPASYYQRNKAVVNCATLQIEAASVLDIQNNPGSTFASVLSHPNGNGKIRITTRDASNFENSEPFVYPSGDFSEFSINDGISEFYTINPRAGAYYILPSNATEYGSVIMTPLKGSNIIMPNLPQVTVNGDLICNGSDADAWLAMSWSGTDYGTIGEKTVNVMGNLIVAGGSFGFIYNGTTLQRINIDGNVYVAPGAGIDVWNSSTNNIMSIGGSVFNNSNNTTAPSGSPSVMRFINSGNRCDLIFTGNRSTIVTNNPALSTTPVTVFNNVTIDKGNSPDTTITWNIGGNLSTPVNNWLTMVNGTLAYDRTGDFFISTTTDFTIPATAGLTINTPSSVYISNSASSETLYLNGRMRILTGGGNVYIGPPGNTGNNADIEYSGSGASLLEVQSGNLFVNGQIRRPLASTNGILAYRQTGGNVFIFGNNTNQAKAKLEVLNDGSEFTMSGGNLTIVRGGGTTFGDLYLRPASGTMTGGTVIFTQIPSAGPVIDSDQSYQLDANIPLNNLTVSGKTSGANRNASLALMISPLVVNGNLSMANSRSVLASNNRNITIRGNLINNGTYNYGTNRTIFDGGVQTITGASVTDFYDMEVSALTSLTVNGNFSVNHDLEIVSGNLVLGSGLLTLRGNLNNNGAYTDDNSTGGINLGGSAQQTMSGTGSFARLVVDNNAGAKLNNDLALQHDLVLDRGVLDIGKYQLTLSQNSIIHGTGFSSSKMIRSDGVASSRGLLKFFPTGAQTFTFPAGVAGKYTPALFTATASSTVGSVRINPVNEYHPAILSPLNALGFYWQAESSGISGLNASLVFSYLTADVSGSEAAYVAARLLMPGGTWDKAAPGAATDNVNEAANNISFYFTGSNNMNGDYTAGNDAAIPDEVPEYITNSNGNWSDASIWTPVGASPPCPAGGPKGYNVIIDHVVTADINFISVLNAVINGELRLVSPTYGHNLGNVTGNGKIYVEGGNLPGGTYTEFTDCSGNGTIEYGGNGTYIIVSGVYSSVPNLIFSGTGRRILPNSDLTVCKRLVIDGPILDNSVNNRKITVQGTFERYNSGAFRAGAGAYPAATVSFSGSAPQTLGGATGDFSGTDRFWNVEINNPAGLTISDGSLIEAGNQLKLTNGVINTSAAGRLVLLSASPSAVTPVGGSSVSYVSGPLTKQIINGDSFVFPLGKGPVMGHRFTLTSAAGVTASFTAEFFSPNTTATSIAPPLEVTNTLEYWNVSSPSAASARIKIGWDPQSDLTPLVTGNGLADMRVARYISGLWTEQPSTASGTNNNGEVSTTGTVSVSATPSDFTTASISGTLARASFSSFTPICGSGGIPVSFISFTPISLTYILSYTINGVAQPDVTVTSLPFSLPANVPGVYRLTGFRFNSGSGTGVVDANTVTVYELPPASFAGTDQSLCGLSTTALSGNNPGSFSGLWTVVSGAGGSFENSTLYNTVFNGVLGVSYTLRWTISNGPCSSRDEVVISFPVVASRPGDFTASESGVCPGGTGYVYTVPFVSGVTYNWSYSGTGHTINGSGNSVTVDFSMAATSGTLSVTATNACGTSPARSVNITVRTASFAYPDSPYCQNGADPLPVLNPGGVAGTFSSTPGLVFINTATGQIDVSASKSGTYTVTNTADAAVCTGLSATATVTIAGQVWNGSVNSSWDNPANWSCGFVPYPVTDVLIPDVSVDPVIASGLTGEAGNLVMDPGASLALTGGTMRIYGSVSGSGSFNASSGTVEFRGSEPQLVVNGLFAGNTVMNMTANNPAGVTLGGPLNVTGVILVQSGELASEGNLTLASDASRTALIDGSGAGTVTGDVTMQRYLPTKFGYRYFSSPFIAATVSEFADDMNLASSFPLFYRYMESRTSSGWVAYNTGTALLNPMEGYSVNFGSVDLPGTVDVTGVVNNGAVNVTLQNHNHQFTKGFNLAGNPYPSPVNWNAAGWTKTNIDNALYFFRASSTDEYGGTYSSYVNGVSSDGIANNIIPSMQGFFVHVSDGTYPVTGTLGATNSVRVNDQTHVFFKSAESGERFLIRLAAAFTDDTLSSDPAVVYFDNDAAPAFDPELDALKLFNTDLMVTNLYSVLPGGARLSVNALPPQADSIVWVPLGLITYRDGEVAFRMRDLENLPDNARIMFRDATAGKEIDLAGSEAYKVSLAAGDYNNRFALGILKSTTGAGVVYGDEILFSAYTSGQQVRATVGAIDGKEGLITIFDLGGRPVFERKVFEAGLHNLDVKLKQGVYLVNYSTGTRKATIKLAIGL
jgi:hypothetical protein